MDNSGKYRLNGYFQYNKAERLRGKPPRKQTFEFSENSEVFALPAFSVLRS
jgi:hypothetical protein